MSSKKSNEEKHLHKMKERFKTVGNMDSKIITKIFSESTTVNQYELLDKKIMEQDKLINKIYKISAEEEIKDNLKIEKIKILIEESKDDIQKIVF